VFLRLGLEKCCLAVYLCALLIEMLIYMDTGRENSFERFLFGEISNSTYKVLTLLADGNL